MPKKRKSTRKVTKKVSPKKTPGIKFEEDLLPETETCSCSTDGCFCCKVKKNKFILPLLLLIVLIALYLAKGLFVVALVNGKPVFRYTIVKELEKQAGKKVFDNFATKMLILEEAKKQKVTVSADEINNEVKQIETNLSGQGQKLDEVLAAQNMTKKELEEQIKIQKLAEKMSAKDVTVSDQEVEEYFNTNKNLMPANTQLDETVKNSLRQRLYQQKVSDKIQEWVKSLQDKSKIIFFSQTYKK